jgi:hypothetical protein
MNLSVKKITSHIASSDNLDAALKEILKEICLYTGWQYGEIWLPDKKHSQLKFSSSYDGGKKIFEHYKKFASICKFAKGVGLVGKVWNSKEAIWFKDILSDKSFLRVDAAQKAGFNSAFAFPVHIKNDTDIVCAFFLNKKNSGDDVKAAEIVKASGEIGKSLKENFSF